MNRPGGDAPRERKPELPRHWRELAPLVDRLLDAPREQRAALLAELSAGDPVRRADLERLVAECERDMSLLDAPAVERFDQLVGDAPAPGLPDVLGGRYRIVRELGRGGMARVYLAEDLKHARNVAVKVVRPELAESLGRGRFLREIGIAARLRHPNIMPLYDSGDADGVLYFVMPHEEGLSLKSRLAGGQPFPITDAVSVLRDVARALAYAHDQGVVHRDVKPDNVMLSGGAAVVTDFGIAKAFSAAQSEAPGGTITQTGVVIGTPAYMAPEQAIGDPDADHRADIYSFGCLAYELFVGKAPFPGASSHQILFDQIATTPTSVSAARSDVPEAVVRLVARCLEKSPAARPQRAQELVDVLEVAPTSTTNPVLPRRRPAMRMMAGIVAAGAVVLGGWLTLRGPSVPTEGEPGQVTITVLPFSSVGGDSLQPLAAGFSDDIATALVRVPWVRVISREGAGNYRGQRDFVPQEIGKALGARYLVMGSVRVIGGKMTAQAKLVRSSDASLLWADLFDRPKMELTAVRDQIVQAISDSLRPRGRGAEAAPSRAAPVAHHGNEDAYRLRVMAQQKLNQRGASLKESIALFRQAITLDSLSAEAVSGLSLALALSPYFEPVSTVTVAPEATATAQRALALDPKLAQPHIALGLVLMHDLQWERAESEFKEAIRGGHEVEARVQYGRYLLNRDRPAEALRQFQWGREDDPASGLVAGWTAYAWFLSGRLDSAQVELTRAMQINAATRSLMSIGASILLAAGRKDEAHRLVAGLPTQGWSFLYATAVSGDRATVLKILKKLDGDLPRPWMAETSRAYARLGLGDTSAALDALELATEARENWPCLLPIRDPVFDGIRESPRLRALVRKVGLPENVPSAMDALKVR